MTAVASGESFEEMPAVRGWLQYADAAKAIAATKQHLSHANHLDALIHTNVLAQLRNLTTHPPVAQSQQNGILTLHASVYDIGPGSIDAVDETQGQFISRSEFPDVRASSPRFH
jgi:carbonic anhydrase